MSEIFKLALLGFMSLFTGWGMCHKEEMGYTCRHRTMSNGKKECGK
jgi:hypothetical protein